MHINNKKGWLDLKSTLFKTLIQNSGCFVAGHFHSSIQKWSWANVYLWQVNSVQSKTQVQDTIFYALTHLLKAGVAVGLKELYKMPKHYLMAWMLKYYIGQIHLYFLSQRRAVFVRLCGMIKHRERQTRTLFLQTTHNSQRYDLSPAALTEHLRNASCHSSGTWKCPKIFLTFVLHWDHVVCS